MCQLPVFTQRSLVKLKRGGLFANGISLLLCCRKMNVYLFTSLSERWKMTLCDVKKLDAQSAILEHRKTRRHSAV